MPPPPPSLSPSLPPSHRHHWISIALISTTSPTSTLPLPQISLTAYRFVSLEPIIDSSSILLVQYCVFASTNHIVDLVSDRTKRELKMKNTHTPTDRTLYCLLLLVDVSLNGFLFYVVMLQKSERRERLQGWRR